MSQSRGFARLVRDGRLATAWIRYAHYLDGELHRCGVNAFRLVLSGEAFSIADTSREEGCKGPSP